MGYFEQLCEAFQGLPEVKAMALGGSRATSSYDEKSDYDLYIYCSSIPSDEKRREILEKNCSYMEMGNQFWEFEDDCTLKDGIDIDILYRNMQDFEAGLKQVVFDHMAYNGYTTCMWHNLLNSRIVYDPDGSYGALQEKYRIAYPPKLRSNIICKNMKLLTEHLPSYDGQVKKAVRRQDVLSMNHRASAFMESYFDIIFAMNEMTHPGEKRMIQKALEGARILPDRFEENINEFFRNLFTDPEQAVLIMDSMILSLKETVAHL